MYIAEQAPAKINLGLCITGRRPDGFHDILSVFQTVDLCDTLHIGRDGAERLICSHPDVPADAGNLVLRAEEAFCARFKIEDRLRFALDKRIPVGGGLGGGSSDAAAALRGLAAFHGLQCNDEALLGIAAELGSDIPFLVHGGAAVITGRGEIVREVAWPFDFTYVLVYPGFGVSTAWAYHSLERFGGGAHRYREMTVRLLAGVATADELFDVMVNDFEPVVFRQYPSLSGIRDTLLGCGARTALLTGSGSTMLGVFDDAGKASACAGKLEGGGFEAHIARHFERM
jgi:4-diphosphocytidyl-2-C-methyl-D-erythritol kinase